MQPSPRESQTQAYVEHVPDGYPESEDWVPLHPMHQHLYDQYEGYDQPVIEPYQGAVRVGIITGAVVGSWGLAWAVFKGLTALLR